MIIEDSVPYHAARLLILLGAFDDKKKEIGGRTLLAKLDFFIRYPQYLLKAADVLKKDIKMTVSASMNAQLDSVESRMVRYRYGPWDHAYYRVLGYLVSKNLIEVKSKNGLDSFALTSAGRAACAKLRELDEYEDLVKLASATYLLFYRYKGTGLKDFIYLNFPEVVNRPIGTKI